MPKKQTVKQAVQEKPLPPVFLAALDTIRGALIAFGNSAANDEEQEAITKSVSEADMDSLRSDLKRRDEERRALWGDKFPAVLGARPKSKPPTADSVPPSHLADPDTPPVNPVYKRRRKRETGRVGE